MNQYGSKVDPVIRYTNEVMASPVVTPGCPPGLELLSQTDEVIIKLITDTEERHTYNLFNGSGDKVYFAYENAVGSGDSRGYKLRITDNAKQEVLLMDKPDSCCACEFCGCILCSCSDCCSMELSVSDSFGQVCGHVRKRKTCFYPQYSLYDTSMQEVGRISGNCARLFCQCCRDSLYPITTPGGSTVIGNIKKNKAPNVTYQTDTEDVFSVSFPVDTDVRTKAVFLGAAFLIVSIHFTSKFSDV